MATGDVTWFDQGRASISGPVDLSSDTIKLGLIDDSVTPTAGTADPRWGTGGTTDLSASEVATGTAYTGPVTLASVTWALVGTKTVLDAANVSIAQDLSGFTDARWGVLFSDTDTGKRALGFVDLGSNRSIQAGPLAINWNAGGILEIARPA